MLDTLSTEDEDGGPASKDDAIVKKVRDCLQDAWEHDKDNRVDAANDLNFLAGNQWPESVRQQRENEGRPLLTINRLPQFVRQVSNDIRQADIAIKVVPSDGAVAEAKGVTNPRQELEEQQRQPQPQGMAEQQEGMEPGMGHNGGPPMKKKKPMTMADVMNGLIREIQYQSSASHVYATTAEHQVACGMGNFRIITQYMDDDLFDQEIRIEAIQQPLNVYWDPGAVKIDRSDAMWCCITQMMPKKSFKAKYPKKRDVSVEDFEVREDGLFWTTTDEVRVAEYWYKKPIKKRIAQLTDGTVVEDVAGIDPAEIVQEREVDTFEIVQYVVSGAEVLDGPNRWAGKYIPVIPVIGSEIPLERRTYRHGLIRFARDPQQLYNYARSSAAEVMGQAPKSPWLVTTKMIGAFKSLWDSANKRSLPYLPYEPDDRAPQGPQRQPPPDVPTAYVQEAGVADADIKATVGIYDPQLGQRSNENSGRAIMAREQQGDTGTFHYSDNLKRSLEYAGRVLIDLIPKIYDNDRVIRILGEDDTEFYVPINREVMQVITDNDGQPTTKSVLLNDLSAGRYDCRVKIGPSYATKRMESADSMMQFMQAFPPAAQVMGDLVAEHMDWPGADAIAQRLKRAVPPQVLGEDAPPQPPDPMQALQAKAAELQLQQSQIQMQELMAKVEKLTAETQKIYAEIGKTEAETGKTTVETQKTAVETELMPEKHGFEAERYYQDREDNLWNQQTSREDQAYNAEAERAQRAEEMRVRANQSRANGSRPSGESNI